MIGFRTFLCTHVCTVTVFILLLCGRIAHNLDLNHVDDTYQSTLIGGLSGALESRDLSTVPSTNIEATAVEQEEVKGVSDKGSNHESLDREEGETIFDVQEQAEISTTSSPLTSTTVEEKGEDSSGDTVVPTEASPNFPHPFEIVYPIRLRRNVEYQGIDTHDYRRKDTHYDHVTVVLNMFGKSIKIKMSLNSELLAENFKLKQSLDEYNSVIEETRVEQCFYQGTVKKFDDSLVAVSTCHGMSGIIRLDNESYVIRPLSRHSNKSGHAHVVYKMQPPPHKSCGLDAGMWEPYQDLHRAEFLRTIKSAKYNQPQDLLSADTKYVDIAMLCDHSLFMSLNRTVEDTMIYILEVMNIMDTMYNPLRIRLRAVLVEIWNIVDHFPVERNPRHMLHHLLHHQTSVLKHSHPDITLMLSGVEFSEERLGLAVPDSICSERSVGVVTGGDHHYPSHAATGLAHMLAHTMGARHDHHRVSWKYVFHDDEEPCSCSDARGCIMDDSPLGYSPVPPRQFSDCSEKDLNGSLVAGLGACLTKDSRMASLTRSYGQRCGNGILERGEECDCGSQQSCALTEPCCDASTCLLQPWATCRHGDCCHNCTVAPPDQMCRAPVSQCDVPEFCTGQSGECPSDALYQDGELCGGEGATSYCYMGRCNTFSDQCNTLWGPDAQPSDFHCYQNFNPSGHFNGHCGINQTTGQYTKCQLEDVRCGLLHCQGGVEQPQISGPHITFSMTKTVSAGNDYECKIVTGELPGQTVGMVHDGSPCAIGGLCVRGHCTPITTITPVTCMLGENNLPCSGNGVCTTKLECFCKPGYQGLACEQKLTTPMTPPPPSTTPHPSTTPPPPVVTTSDTPVTDGSVLMMKKDGLQGDTFIWLMIVLGGVAGSSCVLLLFCMLCYRRRSPHQLLKPGEKKLQKKKILGSRIMMTDMTSCKYETSSEGGGSVIANRAISFGKMPSYRADKIKKAMRKSVGDASETGSEHSTGIRGSTEIPTVIPHSLPTPPARGILKKQESRRRSMENSRRKSTEAVQQKSETEPLRGLLTKGPLPNSPLPWLKAMPARPLPPTPPDDPHDYLLGSKDRESPEREGSAEEEEEESICDSQCPSQCSCDSMDKKSLSDFDDEEGEYTDEEKDTSHDAETQTDPDPPAASAPRGMPRDVSSDSLGETKNKILKLKNINDLLRQIDEQFSSVLKQTAAANDFSSPTLSDESPLSDEERQMKQRLSSIMSSPEPLPSPSCIVSPISHQPPHSPDTDLCDDSTLPIRGSRSSPRGVFNMDPLNILSSPQVHGRRSSTPKRESRSSPVRSTAQPLTVNTSEPVVPAIPYRGSFRASPGSGSSSPRSPHSPSPRPSAVRLPIKHPHRPANSPPSDVAQAARLTHPRLDGYPFKRSSTASASHGPAPVASATTGSDRNRPEADDSQGAKVIVREIPKKPVELEFAPLPRRASLDELLSSPENVNV